MILRALLLTVTLLVLTVSNGVAVTQGEGNRLGHHQLETSTENDQKLYFKIFSLHHSKCQVTVQWGANPDYFHHFEEGEFGKVNHMCNFRDQSGNVFDGDYEQYSLLELQKIQIMVLATPGCHRFQISRVELHYPDNSDTKSFESPVFYTEFGLASMNAAVQLIPGGTYHLTHHASSTTLPYAIPYWEGVKWTSRMPETWSKIPTNPTLRYTSRVGGH